MKTIDIQKQFDLKCFEVQLTDDVAVRVINNAARAILVLNKFEGLKEKQYKENARAKMEKRKPRVVTSFGDYAELLTMLFAESELEKIMSIEGFDMDATMNLITSVTALVLGNRIDANEVDSEIPN